MFSAAFTRRLILIAPLAFALAAGAQNPAANPANWRVCHPENALDLQMFTATGTAALGFQSTILAPTDSVLFAKGGYGGRLMRTTNAGQTWEVVSPVPPPAGLLTFFSAQQGLVRYDSSATLPARVRAQVRFTTDGGTTWGAPRPAPVGQIEFLSPTMGFAFQARPANAMVIYRTLDAGQTWAVLDSLTGLPSGSKYISLASPNTAYLVYTQNSSSTARFAQGMIQIQLGRHAWRARPISIPTADTTSLFTNGVKFKDDSTGAITLARGFRLWFLRTTNGGRTWTSSDIGHSQAYNMAIALAGDEHYIMHQAGPFGYEPMESATNRPSLADYTPLPIGPGLSAVGKSFNTIPTPLALRSSGVAWAVGDGGRVYRSLDFGVTWTMCSRVLIADQFSNSAFPDPSVGWVGTWQGGLMQTRDHGDTWHRPTGALPPHTVGVYSFPDADTIFSVQYPALATQSCVIYRSIDAGQTWVAPQQSPSVPYGDYVHKVLFHGGARRGIAVGSGGIIWRTIDGGENWQSVSSFGRQFDLIDISWASDQIVFAIDRSSNRAIIKSADGGATWQQLSFAFPSGADFKSVVFSAPSIGWLHARGTSGDVNYRTTDGGQTWQPITTRIFLASFSSPAVGWTMTAMTQDSGRTWLPAYGVTLSRYYSNDSYGVVAVDADNCFRMQSTGVHGATYSEGATVVVERYSRRYARLAPLAQTTLATGSILPVSFTTEGEFAANERDFRVELSNAFGRFRRGQTLTVGRGATSPINITLPANLPPGTAYRLRIVRADSSLLGGDTGQRLTIQAPTGLVPDGLAAAAPQLYPNPAQQMVSVRFAEGAQAGRQVRLLDLTGRAVLVQPATAAETPMSLRGLGAGCYLLEVRAAGGRVQTQRLMVQP